MSCDHEERLPPGMLNVYDLNKDTSDGILVFVETIDDNIHPSVPGIIGEATRLSDGRVYCVVFASSSFKKEYDTLYSLGIDTIHHYRSDSIPISSNKSKSIEIASLCKNIKPSVVLFPATPEGREVAPSTAALLRVGLTADCTELEYDGTLKMTRPALGGNILATITSKKHPHMATVRPGIHKSPEPIPGRKGTVIVRRFNPSENNTISIKENNDTKSICDADILISLGNGVRKKESVDIALKIADIIGASVSCSRPLVEKGWMSASSQVGLSGKTVSPKIYLAFGLSGSVQHMAGVRAEKIISINRDSNASIVDNSDIFIQGDVDTILKKLLKSLQ